MAKKISLGSSLQPNPSALGDEAVVEIGGVRYTPDSSRNPNSAGTAGENEAMQPLVKVDVFDTQDANDGSEDGEQKNGSFQMPPFANGRDMRNRG